MTTLFWISCFGVVYSYFLYPLILLLLPHRDTRNHDDNVILPHVTIIITAYNEEGMIAEKIRNTLALDYPQDKIEIIVASDASTDKTDDIVSSFEKGTVRLVRAPRRRGKEFTQSCAIKESSGEILVFSDVSTRIEPDSIRKLVWYFSDPGIGAVSSEDRFVGKNGELVGEGAYVKYEMWLRRMENHVAGVVGLSGSFFAARKEICNNWDLRIPSDFNTALNSVRHGFISISAPDVIGVYENIRDEKREYNRKCRTVLRGISAIYYNLGVLNPFTYGLFSFQVWSHKIMRWLVPWFLISLAFASVVLIHDHWFYTLSVYLQAGFYILVLLGAISRRLSRYVLFKVPYYFIQANLAIAHASIAFLLGKRIMTWNPSKR